MPPEADLPGPHPYPPPDLSTLVGTFSRALPIRELSGPWFRSYHRAYSPRFFGRTKQSRFDAPSGEFGVLYAATDEYGAFIETFGRRLGISTVTLAGIAERRLARILASRPLRLVDLTGPGLAQLGADARLLTGDYRVAQRWSLAFHQHHARPDGVLYRSRHDPSRTCVALYERAEADIDIVPVGSFAAPERAELLADILATYGFSLIEDMD